MSLFSSQKNSVRYGALVDIGSGSVLAAILKSDPRSTHPEIIWSKREYVPLRNTTSLQDSAKHVMTSLMNALMLLDSEGRKVYQAVASTQRLPEVQVTIAAPWSYTVTKDISYTHANGFTLSQELVEELLRTAEQKVAEELAAQERVEQLGLTIITRSVVGLIANGYAIDQPSNQEVKTLKIYEANAIAQDYLVKAIGEVCEKLLPSAKIQLFSFILVFYTIIRHLEGLTSEYCLVDITYEATELGVIRDGILQHTTHTPFGAFSIAREIAAALAVPLEEAYSYLYTSDPTNNLTNVSSDKKADLQRIFDSYEEQVSLLFHETGDALAIPKKIFIHGNLRTEPFFTARISDAAKRATKSSHVVQSASVAVLDTFYPDDLAIALRDSALDTALLISSQFFHMIDNHHKFEQR